MSRGRCNPAAAAAALGLIAAAGCGSTPAPSIALHSQATRVCRHAARELGRIATPAGEAGGEAFLNRGVAVLGPEVAALRALRPADATAAEVYAGAIHALSGELSALHHTVVEISHGEDPVFAFKALQQRLAPLESTANGAWQALQIPACLNN